MAIKTIRVFAEYTSDGYVPMPSQGNIDYGVTVGSTFPETQPSSFQTDDPNIDVAVTTMTDFYVWIRTHGSAWNPNYTRVVRVYPDSPSINSVVMNMIVAVGGGGTTISSGGGVNYYLNGGTSQGVLDGSTYYEMNKVPVQGTGVDFFKINTTGFENIAQFVTDAGDPALLNIPAGNWPLGFYMSASDNSGSPKFYAEIYKYSAAGVFTLLGSSVATPEVISNGQAIDYYTSTVSIPDTTLLVTDRIAIRIFVNTDGNRTINLHTQDSHLSTVGTTFTRGLTAINGLIKQVQFLAIGNAGSDAAIVSSDDTHTINLPTASATKRGLLNSTDWSTFNAKQPALSGDGFVKISGSTISYDNSSYQPLDGDLTAIGALAGTSGILKKTGANTWALDTTVYLNTTDAASTYQRLDKMVSNLLASDTEYPNSNAVLAALALKANATNPAFSGYLTISGASPKIYLTDTDNNPDYFIGNDDGYFRIYDQTNSLSRFYITNVGVSTFPGDVIVGSIAKSGGTASQFLKADGTVDSTAYATSASLADYLTSATAATTYQRLDKMVSNLLPSDTEYPNSNAVLAKLALKADAANPSFTGSMNISGAESRVNFYDENAARKYFIGYDGGFLRIYQDAGSTSRFYINSSGKTFIPGTLEVGTIIKTNGLATEFLKADGTVDSNTYALNSALANYLLSATAGTTYQTLANLSTDLTASTTKYPSVTAVNDGLATKQPLDADLTAIAGLAGTSGLLKKTAADTWTLDTAAYITSSALTNYLLSADAATTYQRKDKMVSNLLASDTEYPNSNAVIAALALKANAANPTFTGNFTISGDSPKLYFVDTDNNPDYTLFADSGYFYIYDQTAGATRFSINSSGNINSGVGKSITAGSFIKESGTASQFLKADGSVDSNSYITSEIDTLATVTGRGNTTSSRIGVLTSAAINLAGAGNSGTWIGGVQDAVTGWSIGNNGIGLKADDTTYATIGLAPSNGILYFGRTTDGGVNTLTSWLEVNSNGVANFIRARPQFNGNTILDVANYSSYAVPLAGGTMTGGLVIQSSINAWGTTTQGGTVGGLHLGLGTTTANAGPAITFGARDASNGANAQAGIYINSDGNYGTRMYLATTDSYATGSKTAISISETGLVNFVRANPTVQGNAIIHAGNIGSQSVNYATSAGSISGFNNPTTSATANTIAYRDSSGDLYTRYFLGSYINTSDNVDTGSITYIMAKFGDNYHRSATASKVQSFLGLGSAAYQNTTAFAGPNGDATRQFNVFEVSYAATNFNPSAGPRTQVDSMSVKMFQNYFNGTGLGSDYGTVMEYYSLSGHVDSQVYFDASGGSWYRTASYNAAFGGWQRYLTDANYTNWLVPKTGGTFTGETSVVNGASFVANGLNNNGGFAMNNSSTYWGLMWNMAANDWRLGRGSTIAQNGWNLRWDASDNVYINKNLYLNNEYGSSLVGVYSSYRFQGIFAMGDAYKLAMDGTTPGSLYGLSWSHPNAGGQASYLNTHGLLVMENGVTNAAIASNIWARGSITATTNIYGLDVYTTGGWFRNHTNTNGIYWSTTGWHLMPYDSSDFRVHSGNNTDSAFRMETNGTTRGYFYSNLNNEIGILTNDRNWGLRVSAGKNVFIHGTDLTIGASQGASYIYMGDSDEGSRTIHCNSNRIGFLNQSSSWGAWCNDDGSWETSTIYAGNSLRFSGAVSDDNTFGIYFGNDRSFAYGIYRESGGWSHPYPDLKIAFHTGISLGANPSYGGIRFFSDYDMSTVVLYVNNASYGGGGNVYATGTITATAFYESSDSRLKNLLEDDIQVKGIENLKAKRYIKNGKEEYGYFAQEAETYMPSVVTRNADGYLNLSYREVHTAKIARLEKRVAELEKQLNVA